MIRAKRRSAVIYFLLALLLLTYGCQRSDSRESKLLVLHADSLAAPFEAIKSGFEKAHPEIKVQRESSGSIIAVRKISELFTAADVLAVADCRLIPELLMPKCTTWYVRFARNEIVIAGAHTSKYISEISSENWHQVLARRDVSFGRADPNLDPCGYWTLIVWQLANDCYNDKTIAAKLKANSPNANVYSDGNQLLAILETPGNVDYAWVYRSQAENHNLRYVELPAEINLGDPKYSNNYATAAVETSGEPGKLMIKKGRPIAYGITIPTEAPNSQGAELFVKFVLGHEGQAIMREHGFGVIAPAEADDKSKVPKALRNLIDG